MWAVNYSETDEGNQPIDPEMVMKIDVGALSVVGQYDGLDRPYTYSDFTGNVLQELAEGDGLLDASTRSSQRARRATSSAR